MAPRAVADDCAAPGATPECMATALKRPGKCVAISTAMLAPADSPATATRSRSTGWNRQTWSTAAISVAASARALPVRVSYQFQQPCGFTMRSCSG